MEFLALHRINRSPLFDLKAHAHMKIESLPRSHLRAKFFQIVWFWAFLGKRLVLQQNDFFLIIKHLSVASVDLLMGVCIVRYCLFEVFIQAIYGGTVCSLVRNVMHCLSFFHLKLCLLNFRILFILYWKIKISVISTNFISYSPQECKECKKGFSKNW